MNRRPIYPTPAREAMEATVRTVVSEVAGWAELDSSSDFFVAGLDSLAVAGIVAGLQRRLAVDVPLAAGFEYSNITDLAAFLGKSIGAAPRAEQPAAAAPGQYFPAPAMTSYVAGQLGPAWERTPSPVWVAAQLPVGTIDARALRSALDVMVERHEALRVSLYRHGDEVRARVDETGTIPLEVVDAPDADDREINQIILERRDRLFDRTRAPLAAATLIRQPAMDILCMVVDHNIGDPWSLRMLLVEILQLCNGTVLEPRQDSDLTFSQWCAIEHELLQEGSGRAAEFWCELLEPARNAAAQPSVPSAPPGTLVTRRFEVDAELCRLLHEQASAEGLSLFAVLGGHLLHAVSTVLGVESVPMAVHALNRDLVGTSTLLASTVCELWLAVDVAANQAPEQAAAAFQHCLLAAVSHQMTPPLVARDEINAQFGQAWAPWLFLEVRQWQSTLESVESSPRLRAIPLAKENTAPLDLHVVDFGTRLGFELTNWTGFLEPATTDRLASRLVASIAALSGSDHRIAVEDPDAATDSDEARV